MMMMRSSFLEKAAVFVYAALQVAAGQVLQDVNTFGNNTLFEKWRTGYHFTAPAGWMNDPCGAMYDPTRKEYHLFYQWHPNHVNWGNISWGHAISKDLVSWTDVAHTGLPAWENDNAVALWPSEDYDRLGIFSGTAQPVNLKGEKDGTLTIFYTSVRALPTNWRLPYIPGTESQSYALSHDGGRTWEKFGGNPVVESPPSDWNITGWRDPFFEPSPYLDNILGQSEPHYYMVLGSGIKDVGPRIPMYAAPARDLTKWTFLGALWEPTENVSWAGVERSGNQGFNFEVSGVHSLVDKESGEGEVHWYASMGAEGGSADAHPRWSLWSDGVMKSRGLEGNKSVEFEIVSSGVADWGNLYALTSFNDTKHDRRVQWGWSEEDLAGNGITALGYQGALGLPRELFIKKYHNLLNTPATYLTTRGSFHTTQHAPASPGAEITYSATTQGVRPLPDVVHKLRNSAAGRYSLRSHTLSKPGVTLLKHRTNNIKSSHFNIRATLSAISDSVGEVGFVVRMSPDSEELTAITYSPTTARINVHRKMSSIHPGFNNFTNWGHFQPLTSTSGDCREAQQHEQEKITFDIYVDNSLLEVFVNERFALTTRVYPWRDDSSHIGYYLSTSSDSSAGSVGATFEDVRVWTGLGGTEGKRGKRGKSLVWPERRQDTSSELVWDGPEGTGNFTWWPGN